MDPNANLEEQRRLFAQLDNGIDFDALSRLAELAQALDEWLSKGGFLPRPWLQARVVVTAREAAAQKGVEYDADDEVVGSL